RQQLITAIEEWAGALEGEDGEDISGLVDGLKSRILTGNDFKEVEDIVDGLIAEYPGEMKEQLKYLKGVVTETRRTYTEGLSASKTAITRYVNADGTPITENQAWDIDKGIDNHLKSNAGVIPWKYNIAYLG